MPSGAAGRRVRRRCCPQTQPGLQPGPRDRPGLRLDPRTPAYDIQQACGTGLQAVIAAANKITLGAIDSAIAGGADTTSDAPSASTTSCAGCC
ncbi:beta-ketoacyl synthase N-terminal-like domain-containing protein [Streptomyces sp. M10(2022)]